MPTDYFTDRCGRAVEYRRDTWAMCGLENGHEGPCEPARIGEQTVIEPPAATAVRGSVRSYFAGLPAFDRFLWLALVIVVIAGVIRFA